MQSKLLQKIVLLSLFYVTQQFFLEQGYAQFQNIRVSGSIKNADEVSIAVNPTNPEYLSAGANIYYFFGSSDGGLTWKSYHLTSFYDVWGDPCLQYDPDGNLYYCHLSGLGSQPNWLDRIVIQKSSNNGATWYKDTYTGYRPPKQQDKEWLAIDHTPTSPYYKNLYLSWTEFDRYSSTITSDSSRIQFSRSSDGGESWSDAIAISKRGGNSIDNSGTVEGSTPTVGPNGEVYIVWNGPVGLTLSRSFDGGNTFEPNTTIATTNGWDFLLPGLMRGNGMPMTGCDISNSPYRGNLYLVWGEVNTQGKNGEVFFKRSTDRGETWSATVRVNNDNTTRDQFFPSMSVDPKTGYIYIVFYDRRDHLGDTTDVYLARSTDGGSTFDNWKISSFAFVPKTSKFLGDYIGIAAYDRKVHPIWVRMEEDNSTSIWTANIDDALLSVQPVKHLFTDKLFTSVTPEGEILEYSLSTVSEVVVDLVDISGKNIRTVPLGLQGAGTYRINMQQEFSGVKAGIYFCRMNITGNGSSKVLTGKIIITR